MSRVWTATTSFAAGRSVRAIMTSTGAGDRIIKFGPFEVTKQVSSWVCVGGSNKVHSRGVKRHRDCPTTCPFVITYLHLQLIITSFVATSLTQPQVFLSTPHSFALVNLKPLIPGHILVCPHAPHRRLTDMSAEETADLFTTVQLMQRLLARAYFPTPDPDAGSFSVAVQDGAAAGQTVPHVHVHVIPRQAGDLGTPDVVYVKMAGEDGNVGGALWDQEVRRRPVPGGSMPRVDDEDRRPRTEKEMMEETEMYKALLREMGVE